MKKASAPVAADTLAAVDGLTWKNVTVRLGDLQPWDANPKTLTKHQAQRLLKSWRKLGQFQNVAIGPGGEVYDGNQRLSVLLAAYGLDYRIEARQASRALTDDERRALTIAAGVPAGAWDWDMLAAWDDRQLSEWGLDAETLEAWRGDAAALQAMLDAAGPARLDERDLELTPRAMLRVLISVPLDAAIEVRDRIDALQDVEGLELDYSAN